MKDYVNRKSLIKQCNALSQHFLDEAIQFRALSKSIEQNKVKVDIKAFIEKRTKAFLEVER